MLKEAPDICFMCCMQSVLVAGMVPAGTEHIHCSGTGQTGVTGQKSDFVGENGIKTQMTWFV